ncbi:MAG: nucleotidyltransferase domain-containing protein [bacterium]|nr:nucleotidyltransferase domain-containing protein [bacterium]
MKSKYGITSLALFGSVVRKDFDSIKSDIDIMVELNNNSAIGFINLADELERICNKKVDLVSKNGIKPKYFEYLKNELVYV